MERLRDARRRDRGQTATRPAGGPPRRAKIRIQPHPGTLRRAHGGAAELLRAPRLAAARRDLQAIARHRQTVVRHRHRADRSRGGHEGRRPFLEHRAGPGRSPASQCRRLHRDRPPPARGRHRPAPGRRGHDRGRPVPQDAVLRPQGTPGGDRAGQRPAAGRRGPDRAGPVDARTSGGRANPKRQRPRRLPAAGRPRPGAGTRSVDGGGAAL